MPRLLADVPRKRWPRQLESRLIAGTQWQGPDYSDGQPTGFIFTGATGIVLQPRKADIYFASVRTRAIICMTTRSATPAARSKLAKSCRNPWNLCVSTSYAITANRYQHVPDELQYLAADHLDAMLSGVRSSAHSRHD